VKVGLGLVNIKDNTNAFNKVIIKYISPKGKKKMYITFTKSRGTNISLNLN